jgi:hypothetical protein
MRVLITAPDRTPDAATVGDAGRHVSMLVDHSSAAQARAVPKNKRYRIVGRSLPQWLSDFPIRVG